MFAAAQLDSGDGGAGQVAEDGLAGNLFFLGGMSAGNPAEDAVAVDDFAPAQHDELVEFDIVGQGQDITGTVEGFFVVVEFFGLHAVVMEGEEALLPGQLDVAGVGVDKDDRLAVFLN